MSACPSPATLKQVVRKESHVCTKSFRPDGSRGFVGSILTGKNYARSPQYGKDNQGTRPEGKAVLGVRLLHDGTVLLRSFVEGGKHSACMYAGQPAPHFGHFGRMSD